MALKNITLIVVAALGLSLPLHSLAKDKVTIHGTVPVQGKCNSGLWGLAKISITEAIATAAKETSGKVTEAFLDCEHGFLVYEIKVLAPNQTKKEVLIDSGTGKLLLIKNINASTSHDDEEEDDEDRG